MTKKSNSPSYTAEFRVRSVRLFRESRADYPSDNAAYEAVAQKLGCSPNSLRDWCQKAERDAGERTGPVLPEDAAELSPSEPQGIISITSGDVTVRLDGAVAADRIAEVVRALRSEA